VSAAGLPPPIERTPGGNDIGLLRDSPPPRSAPDRRR
jgi:hypothetical protein